jgi:membrane-associated phospholipid phosphatase
MITALRGRWRWVPRIAVAGVAMGRIYVGAHNPLDLGTGTSLGVMIGVLTQVVTGSGHQPSGRDG